MPERDLKNVDCEDLARELADRMELDDAERETFIHRCMTRAGYTAEATWVPPDNKEHDRSSGSSGNSGEHERKSKGWFPE